MNDKHRSATNWLKSLITIVFVIAAYASAISVYAQSSPAGEHYYGVSQGPTMTNTQYIDACPDARAYGDGPVQHGPHGEVSDKQSSYSTTGSNWPAQVPGESKQTDPRSFAAINACNKATGADNPCIGRNLVSGNLAATAMAVGMQQAIARAQMPESIMPLAKEMQNQQNQCNADNSANMERNQAGCAMDYVRTYLENFTSDGGNKWNRLRNELFIPIAILLLLPGAVLAQAKAIVAQGFSIFGHVNPFDGIIRGIVAIFLIPSTALVVNYGIDLSNSINHSIRDTYQRIFGSDMYRDAMAAHIRAFPVRQPSENKNYIPRMAPTMKAPLGGSNTAFAKMEGRSLSIKLEDPVAGLSIVPGDRANEMVPYFVNQQRQGYNGLSAGLATTWTILCAFQMAYLYYLWFVGPVVAALWVWPMKQLRDALPNWVDGVITLCFWSLFWNTTVLIMACFRGVDDTGTVIMTALNFLSTACVKFAFDFSGLVKAAGAEAAKMAEKAGQGGGGKSGSKGGGGGQGQNAGQGTKAGGESTNEPGKAWPSSGQQQAFPETTASSSSTENSSSLASLSAASERRSDATDEANSRESGGNVWARPFLAADNAALAAGGRVDRGSASGYCSEDSIQAALVPPPPGQGTSDLLVPSIPGVSGQQVGELEPPLLLNRFNQIVAGVQQDVLTAGPIAFSGSSTTSGGDVPASSNSTNFVYEQQPVLAHNNGAGNLSEYPAALHMNSAPKAEHTTNGNARGFAELVALAGLGARAERLNAPEAGNLNNPPPIGAAAGQLPSHTISPPPLADPNAVAERPGPSQARGNVSTPASLGTVPLPLDGVAGAFTPFGLRESTTKNATEAHTLVQIPPINITSSDGSTSVSLDPRQAAIAQVSSPQESSVCLTREGAGVEYANTTVSSPPDVYALCGLYESPPAPLYQTATYSGGADTAYQSAQAQADVRAGRQSALALVLGSACSVAPPV